jgi:hypothetical protein
MLYWIALVILIIVAIYSYRTLWSRKRVRILKNIESALQEKRYPPQYLKLQNHFKGVSFSLSFWMYISDWNYKFMKDKEVFQKDGLRCYLKGQNNDMVLEIPIYDSATPEVIVFKNVPIQKWMQVSIVLDHRTVDLWINDKLYLSKTLSNIPQIDDSKPLILNKNGGFSGYMSRFYYYDHALGKRYITFMASQNPSTFSVWGLIDYVWRALRHF